VIVLDTNVVSELMKATPTAAVVAWIGRSDSADFCTTSITEAEVLNGVLALPAGRRRRALEQAADAMFAEDFAGRILPFDRRAAPAYAEIVTERDRQGPPISQFDAQIGAITRSVGAVLATRNVDDFDHCGISVVNPWESEPES